MKNLNIKQNFLKSEKLSKIIIKLPVIIGENEK